VAWRPVQLYAPGAQVVIVNFFFRDIIDLRVHRSEFLVEGVNFRVCEYIISDSVTEPAVDFPRFLIAQPLVRKPDSKIATHIGMSFNSNNRERGTILDCITRHFLCASSLW